MWTLVGPRGRLVRHRKGGRAPGATVPLRERLSPRGPRPPTSRYGRRGFFILAPWFTGGACYTIDPDRVPGVPGVVDTPERRTSGILEVPIAWLDLTPPDIALHLKLIEARDTHRAHIWSREASMDEQARWAHAQAGWAIRDEYRSRPHVVSFTIDTLPAGLAWLATLSSCQHIELQPDGAAQLHLVGLREDIQDIHEQLRRSTQVGLVRVTEGPSEEEEEEEFPDRGPQLTDAQHEALAAAYTAGFFEVPREINLEELAERLGRSRSSLSTLLRRAMQVLVEHQIDEADDPTEEGEDPSTDPTDPSDESDRAQSR